MTSAFPPTADLDTHEASRTHDDSRRDDRGTSWKSIAVLGLFAVLVLAVGAANIIEPQTAAGLVILGAAAVAWRQTLFTWPKLMAGLLLVILLIPIRRYQFIQGLPFELEPYRLFMGLILVGWLASLLLDNGAQLRKSPFGRPLAVIAVASLASILANLSRVGSLGDYVMKDMLFLAGFLLLYVMTVSVVRDRNLIDVLLKILVGVSAVLAFFAIIEARTEWNIFNNLEGYVPGLSLLGAPQIPQRGVRLRAYASAEHPIALSALLMMCIPLSLYLWKRTRKNVWVALVAVLFAGAASTASRTGFVMLLVIAAVFLWLRPRDAIRASPLLIPALVLVQLTMPGTLGSLYHAFFPEGGLVAEQAAYAGSYGSGRVADLGPALEEWSYKPLFGEGYGTRVIEEGPDQNALILDNQWLATLLETGALGFIAWAWFLGAVVILLGRAAKGDDSDDGWLMACISAAIAAYAAGMFTYDAFSFIQVTFIAILLCALGSIVYMSSPERWPRRKTESDGAAPVPPQSSLRSGPQHERPYPSARVDASR